MIIVVLDALNYFAVVIVAFLKFQSKIKLRWVVLPSPRGHQELEEDASAGSRKSTENVVDGMVLSQSIEGGDIMIEWCHCLVLIAKK